MAGCMVFLVVFVAIICGQSRKVYGSETYIQTPDIIKELKHLNFSRPWMIVLRYQLQRTLLVTSYVPRLYYANLFRKSSMQMKWCVPNFTNAMAPITYTTANLIHIKTMVPCGYAQIIGGTKNEKTMWMTYTGKVFVIQLKFVVFEVDTSRNKCKNSTALAISEYVRDKWKQVKNWGYCGFQKPWIKTLSSNYGAVMLREVHVRNPCNITFMYTSLDRETGQLYEKHEKQKYIHMFLNSYTLLYSEQFHQVHGWLISVKIGYQLIFTKLELCCYLGQFQIFAGIEKLYLLLQRNTTANKKHLEILNVTNNYFTSFVYLQAKESFRNLVYIKLLSLSYNKVKVQTTQLRQHSVTTINSHNVMLYAAFKLPRKAGFFPNVSFTIRVFHGFTGANCYYGGYFIGNSFVTGLQTITYEQGPYCNDSYPMHPIVGSNGPKYVVLGSFHYYLLFFAYGPFYNIDLDIVVGRSECEGLFEPVHLCSTSAVHVQKSGESYVVDRAVKFRRYVKGSNFQLLCFVKLNRYRNRIVFTFQFFKVNGCILLQTASSNDMIVEEYTLSEPMSVQFSIVKKNLYRTKQLFTHESYAVLRLTMFDLSSSRLSISGKDNLRTGFTKKEVASMTLYVINKLLNFGGVISLRIDAMEETYKCFSSKNSTNAHWSDNTRLNRTFYNLDILNTCGSQIYLEKNVYAIKFIFTTTIGYRESFYTNIVLITNCTEKRDMLTVIASAGSICHAVRVSHEELYLDVPRRSFGIVYEKRTNCFAKMNYRLGKILLQATLGSFRDSRFILVTYCSIDLSTCLLFSNHLYLCVSYFLIIYNSV